MRNAAISTANRPTEKSTADVNVALTTPVTKRMITPTIGRLASEVRVAQQLGTLASLPVVGVIILLISGVIHPTFASALEYGGGLLVVDVAVIRLVARTFDRERLITGARASRPS